MAKTTLDSQKIEVWGSDRVAQGASALVAPSQSTIEKGFVDGIASANDFTWVPNILGGKINHVLQNGVPLWNATTDYVAGNMVVHSNKAWQCLIGNTNSIPADGNANWVRISTEIDPKIAKGYISTPVPAYASTRTVTVNGDAVAKSGDNLYNLSATGNHTVTLNSTGVDGLATGTVAANTWYYLYLITKDDGTGGGYVWSTTQNANSFVISTITYRARQLPLAVRTDASSNILPFGMIAWAGRSSHTRYATQLNGSTSGLTGSTTLIGLISSATYSAFSLASFVPPSSTVATLFGYARGGGGVLFRTTGGTAEYIFDLTSATLGREFPVITNASQSIDARVTINGYDIAVTGYSTNL